MLPSFGPVSGFSCSSLLQNAQQICKIHECGKQQNETKPSFRSYHKKEQIRYSDLVQGGKVEACFRRKICPYFFCQKDQ